MSAVCLSAEVHLLLALHQLHSPVEPAHWHARHPPSSATKTGRTSCLTLLNATYNNMGMHHKVQHVALTLIGLAALQQHQLRLTVSARLLLE